MLSFLSTLLPYVALSYVALPMAGLAPVAAPAAEARAHVGSALVAAAGDTLRGTVVDTAGAPIPDVSVSLVEVGRSTSTNGDGAFVFANVPRARQTLAVRRVGFESLTRQVVVNGTTSVS